MRRLRVELFKEEPYWADKGRRYHFIVFLDNREIVNFGIEARKVLTEEELAERINARLDTLPEHLLQIPEKLVVERDVV